MCQGEFQRISVRGLSLGLWAKCGLPAEPQAPRQDGYSGQSVRAPEGMRPHGVDFVACHPVKVANPLSTCYPISTRDSSANRWTQFRWWPNVRLEWGVDAAGSRGEIDLNSSRVHQWAAAKCSAKYSAKYSAKCRETVLPRRRVRFLALVALSICALVLQGCRDAAPPAATSGPPHSAQPADAQSADAQPADAQPADAEDSDAQDANLRTARVPANGIAAGSSGVLTADQDESLAPDEYVARGLPPVDRPWSAGDILSALLVLQELANEGDQYLPRYQSERSGAVFARLTSPQNLDWYRDSTAPLQLRLERTGQHVQAVVQFTDLYRRLAKLDASRRPEVVEWMGALFRAFALYLEILDEAILEAFEEGEVDSVRRQALETARRRPAAFYSSVLEILLVSGEHDGEEIRGILRHMQETFPGMAARLPESVVTDTLSRLGQLLEGDQHDYVRVELEELRHRIQVALDRRSAR
jgi:hypothetical protein